ncbi:hypothetical protein BOVATA_026360 [Babesia ovata]|uniref:Uncharacterized protein n=1 Tax=Babesia ovata TaxID=189622 RepID=A0A2H6KDS2_9APIC|nr:uncharacterized protein BOVATA_026360 [Babesia ovata]GBE61143.1 hypothetical protein BOVATA_026360 [Babesia ovata]
MFNHVVGTPNTYDHYQSTLQRDFYVNGPCDDAVDTLASHGGYKISRIPNSAFIEFDMCLSSILNKLNLRKTFGRHQGAHVSDDVTVDGKTQLARCPNIPAIEKTVQHGTSIEVTGTSGVNGINSFSWHIVVHSLVENNSTLAAHHKDHSSVLGEDTGGPLGHHPEKLLAIGHLVQLGKLLDATSKEVRLVSNGLQELTVLLNTFGARQNSDQTLVAAKSGVNHLVSKRNLLLVSKHETVHGVVVKVLDNGFIKIIRLQSVRGFEASVALALSIRCHQREHLGSRQTRDTDGKVINTVIKEDVADVTSQIIITTDTKVRSLATKESVAPGDVGRRITRVVSFHIHRLTYSTEILSRNTIGFAACNVEVLNHG